MATQNQFVTFTPYDEQMAELQRRQKMAELMQQQAIQPLETPQSGGRMIAKVSPMAGLAKMLQSYMAGSELRNVEKQRGVADRADMESAMDFLKNIPGSKSVYGEGPASGLTEQQATVLNLNPNTSAKPSGLSSDMEAAINYQPQQAQKPSMVEIAPSATERTNYMLQGAVGGSPRTRAIAAALMKPTEYEGGIQFTQAGKPYMVSKTGEIKFINIPGITPRDQYSTQTAEGVANRAQAERHWGGLSADQQANIMLRARSGEIEAQRLLDDAGIKVPMGAGLPATNPTAPISRATAPAMSTAAQGNIPQNIPQPPVGQPPAQRPGIAPIKTAGLSPKQQRELAAKDAETQREAKQNLPEYAATVTNAVNAIDQMLGTAGLSQEEKNARFNGGNKKPHPGFENYVGMGVPFASRIPGTDAAGFRVLENQVKGQAFMQAYKDLRGSGAISEAEGAKASQAQARMDNSTSEDEYIRAAREFQSILMRGLDRQKARAAGQQPEIADYQQQYPKGVTGSDW